jgi:chromosome segregation ATPase
MKRISKILIGGLLIVLISLGGFSAYQMVQQKKEIESLMAEVAQLKRIKASLKKKYAVEKARVTAFQRAKLAVEAQKRVVENELANLKIENDELRDAQNEFEKEVAKRIKGYSAKLKALTKEINGLQAEYKQLQTRLKEASGTIAARKAEIERLSNEKRQLLAELDTKQREIERMRGHNKQLVALAGEMIVRYEQKGIKKIILEKDPFLGLTKVKWEHIKQEYQDRIDKHALDRIDD